MTDDTTLDLDALDRMMAAAAPAPWTFHPDRETRDEDAQLIVAMRDALPQLVRIARAAQALVDDDDAIAARTVAKGITWCPDDYVDALRAALRGGEPDA